MVEHNADWHADRAVALALRRQMYNPDSASAIYENDDKCGSHWLLMPVVDSGRDSKKSAAAKYDFAIQANVVCGEGGVCRLAVVPSNVATGSSFGLTNLVMVIWRAWKKGRLKTHTKTLIRHTDGGGDNVSYVTHIVHWLLVYLGIFDEVLWFRFEAGHSHTEISDRLFGLMRKIFKSDTGARVRRCPTLSELFARIDKELAKCPEERLFEFDLANWDFEEWLAGMNIDRDDGSTSSRGLFEGKFARYTFDNVYRYMYTEGLWQHGGVKVTFKERLSLSVGENDDEWGPVVERERPPPGGNGPPVTVTTPARDPTRATSPARDPTRARWCTPARAVQRDDRRGDLLHPTPAQPPARAPAGGLQGQARRRRQARHRDTRAADQVGHGWGRRRLQQARGH